jgi:hypothetical protein
MRKRGKKIPSFVMINNSDLFSGLFWEYQQIIGQKKGKVRLLYTWLYSLIYILFCVEISH